MEHFLLFINMHTYNIYSQEKLNFNNSIYVAIKKLNYI